MEIYRVGFTGTSRGMAPEQKQRVLEFLSVIKLEHPTEVLEFHFGLCIGADEQAAIIAKRLGFRVVAHPGTPKDSTSMRWRSEWSESDEVREPKPFISRDRDIVDETDEMVATPVSEKEERASGTWTTVRYARKKEKKVTVLNPKKMLKFDPHALPVKTNAVAGDTTLFGPTHRQRGIR